VKATGEFLSGCFGLREGSNVMCDDRKLIRDSILQ